jgi:hypothetical protein
MGDGPTSSTAGYRASHAPVRHANWSLPWAVDSDRNRERSLSPGFVWTRGHGANRAVVPPPLFRCECSAYRTLDAA